MAIRARTELADREWRIFGEGYERRPHAFFDLIFSYREAWGVKPGLLGCSIWHYRRYLNHLRSLTGPR